MTSIRGGIKTAGKRKRPLLSYQIDNKYSPSLHESKPRRESHKRQIKRKFFIVDVKINKHFTNADGLNSDKMPKIFMM